ncbi:hypothetical protein EYC80_001775 [Monilinia laxa]|nr:hypothetical protein EYC80_001775 [Monilinia laxa]
MAALIQLNCINTITNLHLVTANLFEQLSIYLHRRTRQNGFLLSNRWKASWLPLRRWPFETSKSPLVQILRFLLQSNCTTHALAIAVLGSLAGVVTLSTRGGSTAKNQSTPPINAKSPDEEKYIK